MINKKVLILDNKQGSSEQLIEKLQQDGFESELIKNNMKFFEKIESFNPDIIVLDKKSLDSRLNHILKSIRSSEPGSSVPIIMLTSGSSKKELIESFNSGVSDFVTEPFEFEELAARITYACSKTPQIKNLIEFKNISLCTKSCSVKVEHEEISLTLTEFKLLRALMINQNEVLQRDRLCKEALGKVYSISRTIDVHMLSLRNKLKGSASFIKTVRGVGYKLSA